MFGVSLFLEYLRGRRTITVVECRHCGTSADPDADQCSVCGHDGIARYVIE